MDTDPEDPFNFTTEQIERFVESWKENGGPVTDNYPISLGDIRQLMKTLPGKIVYDMVGLVKIKMFNDDNISNPILTAILNGMVLGAAMMVREMTDNKPLPDLPRED